MLLDANLGDLVQKLHELPALGGAEPPGDVFVGVVPGGHYCFDGLLALCRQSKPSHPPVGLVPGPLDEAGTLHAAYGLGDRGLLDTDPLHQLSLGRLRMLVEVDHDELLAEMQPKQGQSALQLGPVCARGECQGVADGTGVAGNRSS